MLCTRVTSNRSVCNSNVATIAIAMSEPPSSFISIAIKSQRCFSHSLSCSLSHPHPHTRSISLPSLLLLLLSIPLSTCSDLKEYSYDISVGRQPRVGCWIRPFSYFYTATPSDPSDLIHIMKFQSFSSRQTVIRSTIEKRRELVLFLFLNQMLDNFSTIAMLCLSECGIVELKWHRES